MASIYQRGNVWWILYYQNGRRVRKPIGRDKKAALSFKREVEYKLTKGQLSDLPGDNTTVPIKIAKEDFIKKISLYVRPKTIQNYRLILDKFVSWLDARNIVALGDVNKGIVENFMSDRKDEDSKKGGKIKNSTLGLELKAVKYFLKTCAEMGYLKSNFAREIKPIKPEKKLPYFFSEEDLEKIFNSGEAVYYKKIYLFLLLSGIRVGELCNLYHEDIDLDKRRILIRQKPDWKPKTGERIVPMSEELAELILSISKSDKKYFFVNERGEKLTVQGLDTRFRRLRKPLGIETGTLHTFRHTFASYLTMRTGNIRALQLILGHQKIETTQMYSHLSDDNLKAVADQLDFGVATILATMSKKKTLKRRVSC